jgi:hypothetical protein
MKTILTLFILFALNHLASAQEYVIKLNPNPPEDTAVKHRNFYFDTVQDNREVTGDAKVVGQFGKNKKTTVLLEGEPEKILLAYLQKIYQQRNSDVPLTFRINELHCTSEGGMLSEAKVKIDVDIVNSQTNDVLTNLSMEKTKQPLMGGKTFGILLEELISYCVSQVKIDKK